MATPYGNYQVGSILSVSQERATQLVNDKAAEWVEALPVEAPKQEVATLQPEGETATRLRGRKSK